MKILMVFIAVTLTGCATPPRFLAAIYDGADRCQRDVNLSWCGAGSGTTLVTRDYQTGRYLTTTKVQK